MSDCPIGVGDKPRPVTGAGRAPSQAPNTGPAPEGSHATQTVSVRMNSSPNTELPPARPASSPATAPGAAHRSPATEPALAGVAAAYTDPSSLQQTLAASERQQRYEQLLNPNNDPHIGTSIPELTRVVARKLFERSKALKLFLHSYSLSLNFAHGGFGVFDMMRLAVREGLAGIKIHVQEGGPPGSLASMSDSQLRAVRAFATANNLTMHLETSSTSRGAVNEIVRVALALGVTELRVYVRPEESMRLSELKAMAIADLRWAAGIAEEHQLQFVLEPHEVLKSHELVEIIEAVDSPRVNLLFDFGNMVNANEHPLEALATIGPYVTQVHAKDVKIVSGPQGRQQIGVKSGTGDLNLTKIMHDLLLLGEDVPQVRAIGLEEEVGYVSPAFRFTDEKADPLLPYRDKSSTQVPDDPEELKQLLDDELHDAHEQLETLRGILERLHGIAAETLGQAD